MKRPKSHMVEWLFLGVLIDYRIFSFIVFEFCCTLSRSYSVETLKTKMFSGGLSARLVAEGESCLLCEGMLRKEKSG